MATNQKNKTRTEGQNPEDEKRLALTTKNYQILVLGIVVILLGFILMAGGESATPENFSYDIYSWRRITLAPILVVAGFVIEIVGIVKRFDK